MAELPVIDFIQTRLAESDTSFETRPGSAFYDLFIKPQQLMIDPLLSSLQTITVSQSVKRVLDLEDPDSFDESLVDDLAGNVYVTRAGGDFGRTTVRVYYSEPVDREFAALSAEFIGAGLSFFNIDPILITRQAMTLQQQGTLYYLDVPVRAQNAGAEYNLSAGAITRFVNDADAISVTNLTPVLGGLSRETNTQLLTRARNSIGVRDLETTKGINAILLENFPYLQQIQSIGMGDPEMVRDILYNVHVGGATDVYVKPPQLTPKSKDIVGLVFDTTRQLKRSVSLQLTAQSFSDAAADLGTPNIFSGSVSMKDDIVETPATIRGVAVPAVSGIDLSGKEWLRVSVDSGAPVDIKVSGATPSKTQKFEIINSINAAIGQAVAGPYGSEQIQLISPRAGSGSQISFYKPQSGRTDATAELFPAAVLAGYVPGSPSAAATISGVTAPTYLENIDFEVDYDGGKVRQLAGSQILSGKVVASSDLTGAAQVSAGSAIFTAPGVGAFDLVRVGDLLTILSEGASIAGEYVVQEKVGAQTLRVLGLNPSSAVTDVEYRIVSGQTVSLTYSYAPLSVDIGGKALLADGVSRGVRPGRESFTITDLPIACITSIEEIDPETGDLLGVTLSPPGGFGDGGFGLGGFGISGGGDYRVIIDDPSSRFSVHDSGMIVFNKSLFGRSYRINYLGSPEVAAIHTFCRDDLQRVTGADLLPKIFVPALVDLSIDVRQDPANLAAPTTSSLLSALSDLIHAVPAGAGLEASEISKTLELAGVVSVKTPFTMSARIMNPDGSTTVISSEDVLQPANDASLVADENFVTPRIVHFFPGNITINTI